MTEDLLAELKTTGRCYVAFDFGDDLARLVPALIAAAQDDGMTVPEITLAGSNTLLVRHPEIPDTEETTDDD